jgi:tetratricopeptide (TPR) repeat protein
LDAEKGDDPVTLASLYNTLGGIFWQWGNLSEAATYVERSLEAYQSMGYAWGMAIAYTNLGILHYVQGMWPQAMEYFERAYVLRRENGYLSEQAVSLNNLGLLRIAMGDHAQAQQDLEASLAISQRLGDDFGVMYARVGLGHLAIIQSRFAEAAPHIEAALGLSDDPRDQAVQARWLWALIQAENGDLPGGLESVEQGLQMARKGGLVEAEADCRRVLGHLRSRAGDDLEAEALLHEAMDLYLQLNAPYGQALTMLELGYLYQKLAQTSESTGREPAPWPGQDGLSDRPGWRAKALTAFDSAVEQFDSLGAAHDLHRAQAALKQLQAEMVAGTAPPARPASGSPAPLRPGQPEGEWHTAAIVWLELSPPPNVDEEAVFETMAQTIPALTVIAREYQGRVIRRPDGLTVVFGAPAAYEDDAERAVQTAWDLAHYLQEPAGHGAIPLTARLAVSYGEVVAGHIGSALHTEFSVRGDPVQQAQRIAAHASPGRVWVTAAVQAATQRLFSYQPVADAAADLDANRPEVAELPVLELVGLREQPGPARGLVGLKTRLIGREKPLQAMNELTRYLNRGMGGLIWIEGEPGIGKSRLMREFATSTATIPIVWSGKCLPQRTGQAFWLFSDVFTQALNLQTTDTPDQIRTRIQQTIQTWPRDVQMTRPYLETLLGVQPGGLEGRRLNSLEPEQLRQQIFVALRRLFKSLAGQQPIVLLLDDLHWIDPMSAELLQFLLPMVTSVPILFVCAQRRQGADSPNDRLVRTQSLIPTQTVRLTLERLSTPESEALLGELLPQVELPARLRRTILERSEGNPYFIEEYVRVLIDQGHVHYYQGQWSIAEGQDLGDIPLPSSLETLIRSRIDALPAELKQLMQHAAVIGASFEASLLEVISELPNVARALARLETRLLVHGGIESGRWEFNHSLIETVVYNSMLKVQRRAIHLKVAHAMETRWKGAEAEHAEELAYHYTQGGEGSKAVTYLVLAGERAAARFANEEGRTYFEQATQQLSLRPEAEEDLHWRVAAGLGDVYRAMGQYPQSKTVLEDGLALVEMHRLPKEWRAGLHRRLGETAQKLGDLDAAYEHFGQALTILGELADSQAQAEIARVLNDLAWIHLVRGNFDQARAACEASLTYARSINALGELAAAENTLGGIYYRQNEWKLALHHTTRAMILREQMGYTWGVASTLSNLGVLAVSAGQWSKARSFFERSLAQRQELGDVEGIAIGHNNLGTLARDQGELELAEAHFRQSLAAAAPFKIAYHITNANLGLAQALLWKGEVESAYSAINASLDQAEAIGAQELLAEINRVQAEIWLAKSAWDEARSAVEQAAALASEMGNHSLEVAAWRVASEIELRCEDIPAARETLGRAQRALARANDELEAGRVAAQAGRLYLHEGQLARAEVELRVAQEIFMRLGASLDLRRVEAALAAQASP